MRTTGWIFFAISWGFLIVLNVYCFTKVFSKKR